MRRLMYEELTLADKGEHAGRPVRAHLAHPARGRRVAPEADLAHLVVGEWGVIEHQDPVDHIPLRCGPVVAEVAILPWPRVQGGGRRDDVNPEVAGLPVLAEVTPALDQRPALAVDA